MLNKILKYYVNAKRTAMIAQHKTTNKYYHIFSIIELMTEDMPEYSIPNDEWYKNKIIRSELNSKSSTYSFSLVINDLDIETAIAIYTNPLKNTLIDSTLNNYFNLDFCKEPSGSYPIVIPPNFYTKEGIGSIIPKRHCGSFVWTNIDKNRTVENMFYSSDFNKEMKSMSQLTNKWLGFDIWSKSEHIGNNYLVAPNPYLRRFGVSLSPEPIGINFSLKYRKNINETLYCRIIDKHGEYTTLDKEYEINYHTGFIGLPHEPHMTQILLYNSDRDLVSYTTPTTFVKSFKLDMSVKHSDFKINLNGKESTVEKFSKVNTPSSKTENFIPEYYFKKAENERSHIKKAEDKEFIFLHGIKDSATKTDLRKQSKKIIHEIINKSNDSCYICDPYFNVNDLVNYAFYIKDTSVDIRILNAKEYIDKKAANDLRNAINDYNDKPYQKIELRLLRGDKSILHDRFIVSDKDVWYIGTSLNQIGDRVTVISKVPNSSNTLIIREIEKWFFDDKYTSSLDNYLEGFLDNDE